MPISPDNTARADDFINSSEKDVTPANDNGRVVKLEQVAGEDAKIHSDFLPKSPNIIVYKIDDELTYSNNSRFDITNPSGSTFRYTWDGNGNNPSINADTVPIGSIIIISETNFNALNEGTFEITGVGTNYFELENASGVVESNKETGDGYIIVSQSFTWNKPNDLKFAVVEVLGAGGGGGGTTDSDGSGEFGPGGGSGGYAKKKFNADDLGSSEIITVGGKCPGGGNQSKLALTGVQGGSSSFSTFMTATGGAIPVRNDGPGGEGGIATGGDINFKGGNGEKGSEFSGSGSGGNSFFSGGATGVSGNTNGNDAEKASGAGGSGAGKNNSAGRDGGKGGSGLVIITEYFS
jgi:hypothetical protein